MIGDEETTLWTKEEGNFPGTESKYLLGKPVGMDLSLFGLAWVLKP